MASGNLSIVAPIVHHMRFVDIIWAEDNPGDVWMIRHALADAAAVTLRVATTADAALTLMAERRPDLLVLDSSVAMNRMTELCQPDVRVELWRGGLEWLLMLGANDVVLLVEDNVDAFAGAGK